jgi:DNA-binding PadR family transcriptional regulator
MKLSRRTDELTTTSYAILGLLGIRPWTTYELAQQMDRSLGRLWPRAQSKIYEEPKKLAALGFATAARETVGRRPRTVYTITAKGRRALRAWLAEPGTPPALEWEQLLKFFFAEQAATRDDVARTIDGIRAWAEEQRALHIAVAREYATGRGRFPQRQAVTSLTGRFLFEFNETVLAWAKRAAEIVARWPDDPREALPDADLLHENARLEERIATEGKARSRNGGRGGAAGRGTAARARK